MGEQSGAGRVVRHPSSDIVMPLPAFVVMLRQQGSPSSEPTYSPRWTLWGAWRHAVSMGLSCRGRVSRREWGQFLFADLFLLALCVVLCLFVVVGLPYAYPVLMKEIVLWYVFWGGVFCQMGVYLLLLLCSQMVRRLHDIGLSGCWCLLGLWIPPLWLLLCFIRSSARQSDACADAPPASIPRNGVLTAPLRCLDDCLRLNDRSSRCDFAAGLLLLLGGIAAFCYVGGTALNSLKTPVWMLAALVILIVLLLLILSFISVSVRRLHDCRLSSWWALAGLFPVTALPGILYLLLRPSVVPVANLAPLPLPQCERKQLSLRVTFRTILTSFASCFRRWDDYETRTSRRSFWPPFLVGQFLLGCCLWGMVESMYYLDAAYRVPVFVSFLLVCWTYLFFLIPLCVRRLHDMNRSGLLCLLWFVPFCQLGFLSICSYPSKSPNFYQNRAEEENTY